MGRNICELHIFNISKVAYNTENLIKKFSIRLGSSTRNTSMSSTIMPSNNNE